MTDWKLLDREQRGVQLAAMVRIVQKDGVWVVPSQSRDGTKYKVDPSEHSPYCNCPDHELTGHVCKHIYAVRIVRQRELFADGSETITESVTVTQTRQTPDLSAAMARLQPRRNDGEGNLSAIARGSL